MKITYINHSGFLVETENCYYVFDYYKGEMPRLDKSKEVVVFCSHFHQDHFNPKIFEFLDDIGMNYQAVLAKDIEKKINALNKTSKTEREMKKELAEIKTILKAAEKHIDGEIGRAHV